MDSSFGPVAPYYDELMKQVPYRMWVSYYLLLLAHQMYKPASVLDVCCGTGTMCELLTREGFELEGFDISPGMIRVAREKTQKKNLGIRYEVADAAEFEMGRKYDAALSFFDSLNNILEEDRLQSAFDRVYAHLEPEGSFIFDLNTPYAFEAKLFDQRNLSARSKLKYDWVGDWDKQSRIITVTMQFWYQGQQFTEIHRQKAYDEDEVRAMLAKSGFSEIRSFHSYTLNRPRFKTDRIHYVTTKPS